MKVKGKRLEVNADHLLYLKGMHDGTLKPLEGYCDRSDYSSILEDMRLKNGHPWPIPINLEIEEEDARRIRKYSEVDLVSHDGACRASLTVSDIYRIDLGEHVLKVFGTDETKHPGVRKETEKPEWRLGGKVRVHRPVGPISGRHFKTPQEIKSEIERMGWKTVAGFQTRNPVHRAHEHLQRVAMEICDGLLIQPLIGWRKDDDVAHSLILESYEIMMSQYYPRNKVIFTPLEIPMHYAGPREAVFHALIRKNYGCTHFIIGRDHAGVGGYYGRYKAQEVASAVENLGIEILKLKSPFFCKKCGKVVTENTCSHYHTNKDLICEISGSKVRELVSSNEFPPEYIMRKEIAELLIKHAKERKLLNVGK